MKKGCAAAAVFLLAGALLLWIFGGRLKDWGLERLYPRGYAEIVEREAAEFGLEENLVFAVIRTESGFDEKAVSGAGAKGLMQLTQQTFDWMAEQHPPETGGDIFDPEANIHCGCALLRRLLDHYGGLDVALCAYNAGMGNVSGWLSGGEYSHDGASLHTIPFPETKAYVGKVEKALERYRSIYGG